MSGMSRTSTYNALTPKKQKAIKVGTRTLLDVEGRSRLASRPARCSDPLVETPLEI